MVNPREIGCRKKRHLVQPSLWKDFFLTAIIDAMEGRDVMSADIPNAFIQTPMPAAKKGERVITGVLVDLLVAIAPETYGPYVVFESRKKVLYVELLTAMYGQLIAALLWYSKFRGDLENIGYKFNMYDPCGCC